MRFLRHSGSRMRFLGHSGSRMRFLRHSGSRMRFVRNPGSRMRFARISGSRMRVSAIMGHGRCIQDPGGSMRPFELEVPGVFCMYTRKLTVHDKGSVTGVQAAGPAGLRLRCRRVCVARRRASQPSRESLKSPATSLHASSTSGMLTGERDTDADATGGSLRSCVLCTRA